MKKHLLVILIILAGYTNAFSTDGIMWRSPQEVEQLMKKKPKKVIVDFYTDWCGWCKKMDKISYANTEVINYINANFYAIKFDAESKESFKFGGKEYKYDAKNRAHDWAIKFLNGQMSYPSTLFFLENFENPMVAPGFMGLDKFEPILKYINTETFKKQNFDEYLKLFVSEWNKK